MLKQPLVQRLGIALADVFIIEDQPQVIADYADEPQSVQDQLQLTYTGYNMNKELDTLSIVPVCPFTPRNKALETLASHLNQPLFLAFSQILSALQIVGYQR